jgi:hypothetical protein
VKENVFITGNKDDGFKVFWNQIELCSCDTYWKALIVLGSVLLGLNQKKEMQL